MTLFDLPTASDVAKASLSAALKSDEGALGLLSMTQIVMIYAPGRRVRDAFEPTVTVRNEYTGESVSYRVATIASLIPVGETDAWTEYGNG